MKTSIYISSHEKSTGSLIVSIGFMNHLKKLFDKVGFFRPISSHHNNINLMNEYFKIDEKIDDCYGLNDTQASKFISSNDINGLSSAILDKYLKYKKKYDFVLLQGFNYSRLDFSIDTNFNIDLAKNLDSVFVDVMNGNNKSISSINKMIQSQERYIASSKVSHLYSIITRVQKKDLDKIPKKDNTLIIRSCSKIDYLNLDSIRSYLKCDVLYSNVDLLESYIYNKIVADMDIDNLISKISKNDLVIISKDKSSILLSLLCAQNSKNFFKIGAILLTGNMKISKSTLHILDGITNLDTIILSTNEPTYQVTNKIELLEPKLQKNENIKIKYAIELTQESLKLEDLKDRLNANYRDIMTPFMFEHSIFEKASRNIQNIVLPESSDERILRASAFLQNKKIVKITLLGDKDIITNKAVSLGLDVSSIDIINPKTSKLKTPMAKKFYELRKHKGISLDVSMDTLEDYTYFATMMVYMGYCDGMVSGAIHTTANTIRPALETIKTKDNVDIVSSVFFMCMDTKVLVFGDCAINQNPNAKQLAQIAISSATSAKQFGIEPKVAMMSYSSGVSGGGKDVDKVIEATKIIKKSSDVLVEGPLQYDSAIDEKVGKLKMPDSKVAGVANVLIFPDLNTGNNTYKAVQRSGNVIAIGPILQGLKKPVNDLSRGCKQSDIINTVVITALQSIGEKK